MEFNVHIRRIPTIHEAQGKLYQRLFHGMNAKCQNKVYRYCTRSFSGRRVAPAHSLGYSDAPSDDYWCPFKHGTVVIRACIACLIVGSFKKSLVGPLNNS